MEPMKDASRFYEVEQRQYHAERPGFRINELQISPTKKLPWHYHSHVQDMFHVIEGRLRLFLQDPKEDVRLGPGDSYSVPPRRPHLVTYDGKSSATGDFRRSRVPRHPARLRRLDRPCGADQVVRRPPRS